MIKKKSLSGALMRATLLAMVMALVAVSCGSGEDSAGPRTRNVGINLDDCVEVEPGVFEHNPGVETGGPLMAPDPDEDASGIAEDPDSEEDAPSSSSLGPVLMARDIEEAESDVQDRETDFDNAVFVFDTEQGDFVVENENLDDLVDSGASQEEINDQQQVVAEAENDMNAASAGVIGASSDLAEARDAQEEIQDELIAPDTALNSASPDEQCAAQGDEILADGEEEDAGQRRVNDATESVMRALQQASQGCGHAISLANEFDVEAADAALGGAGDDTFYVSEDGATYPLDLQEFVGEASIGCEGVGDLFSSLQNDINSGGSEADIEKLLERLRGQIVTQQEETIDQLLGLQGSACDGGINANANLGQGAEILPNGAMCQFYEDIDSGNVLRTIQDVRARYPHIYECQENDGCSPDEMQAFRDLEAAQEKLFGDDSPCAGGFMGPGPGPGGEGDGATAQAVNVSMHCDALQGAFGFSTGITMGMIEFADSVENLLNVFREGETDIPRFLSACVEEGHLDFLCDEMASAFNSPDFTIEDFNDFVLSGNDLGSGFVSAEAENLSNRDCLERASDCWFSCAAGSDQMLSGSFGSEHNGARVSTTRISTLESFDSTQISDCPAYSVDEETQLYYFEVSGDPVVPEQEVAESDALPVPVSLSALPVNPADETQIAIPALVMQLAEPVLEVEENAGELVILPSQVDEMCEAAGVDGNVQIRVTDADGNGVWQAIDEGATSRLEMGAAAADIEIRIVPHDPDEAVVVETVGIERKATVSLLSAESLIADYLPAAESSSSNTWLIYVLVAVAVALLLAVLARRRKPSVA